LSEASTQQDDLVTSLAADNNATGLRGELTDQGNIVVRALFVILCYQGYAFAFLGVGAPFIAESFHIDQSGIARMYAWISLNSVGALILSRMADRMGRRRIVLLSLLLTPLCSLAAAFSASASLFILFEIITYAGIGATFGSSFVMLAERCQSKSVRQGKVGPIWRSPLVAADASCWPRSSLVTVSHGDGYWLSPRPGSCSYR
jgi:MFS family permease